MAIAKPEQRFERELEIFRQEANEAVQHLYAYLTMHAVAAEHTSVRDLYNANPLFWLTTLKALQTSVFIVLGRIFTEDSRHNINALLRIAQEDQAIFSREALAARKAEIPNLDVDEYVRTAYVPGDIDFRGLRREVAGWRRTYMRGYRALRNEIFAHTAVALPEAVNALFAKTNVAELEGMVIDLLQLHSRLQNLLQNGIKPAAIPSVSSVQELRRSKSRNTLQERVVGDTEKALLAASEAQRKHTDVRRRP